MEIIIIIAAVGFLLWKSSGALSMSVTSTPAPVQNTAPIPVQTPAQPSAQSPVISPAVIAPATIAPITVAAPSPDYQLVSVIQNLQNEIAAITPKPVDPLAPKVTPPPVNNVLPVNVSFPLSPTEALAEAKQSESNLNPRDFANQTWLSRIYGEITSMHTLAWNPAANSFEWSGAYQPGPNLAVIGDASHLALSVTSNIAQSVGSSVAGAIPFIGSAINGIIGLFGAISAHHKAAVQRDATAYNVGLTSCENYLQIISNAIKSGQSTPDEGILALDSMYSDFLTYSAPARNNQPYCNSVCEAKVQLNALVIYWKAYYNALVIAGGGLGNVSQAPVVAPAPVAAASTVPAVTSQLSRITALAAPVSNARLGVKIAPVNNR
jgi:hypothetical protein